MCLLRSVFSTLIISDSTGIDPILFLSKKISTMSYYETVEDISGDEEVEEESEVEEEVVPKRRKQKKWKVRFVLQLRTRCRNLDIRNNPRNSFDYGDFSIVIRIPISLREPCRLSFATPRRSAPT